MIKLSELKHYAKLHVKSQRFQKLNPQEVLDSIEKESINNGKDEAAWDIAWTEAAQKSLKRKHISDAIKCYNFARFPYPVTGVQRKAAQELVVAFEKYYCDENINKHTAYVQGKSFSFYTANLDSNKPCLLVLGGIVSIKEQWTVFLQTGKKMGLSVVVTEFPGVGENSMVFQESSHQMIGVILNQLAGQADIENTYIVGMSFGGQLAIKQALVDYRIKGITTIGAPLNRFYLEYSEATVPLITRRTLSYVCNHSEDDLQKYMKNFALSAEDIQQLTIPVTYIFSSRDEVIPSSEKQFINNNIVNLKFIEFDDIHGSPNHLSLIQKIIPLSVLRQSGSKKKVLVKLLSLLVSIERWKM